MKQSKNHVLIHPETNEFLVNYSDKVVNTSKELADAWISNHDTLKSCQGYVDSVHNIRFKLIELTADLESEKEV